VGAATSERLDEQVAWRWGEVGAGILRCVACHLADRGQESEQMAKSVVRFSPRPLGAQIVAILF
jgi:hypothetical protein